MKIPADIGHAAWVSSPLVTIALPIYNEEKHIEETLHSIINQDYANLEILIFDNHSTDRTGINCQEFAQKDQRIRYHCHEKNIGAGANHILSLEKAHGKYFMWAAGHDRWSTNLVSEAVSLLENHETATIAFGTSTWIDEDGNQVAKCSGWYDTRGLNPVARFFMVFWGSMNPILGIFRRKDLPDLKKYNFVGADLVVLAELSLKGEFIHAAKSTFYRRQNRAVENHNQRMKRYKSKEMQIADSSFFKLFPMTKLPFELIRIVLQAKIGFLEKICLATLLLPSLPIRYILGKKDRNTM